MAEVILPDKSIYEKPPAGHHYEVTMPQGTQQAGVDSGYENRDINVRALIAWFIALGALILVTIAILYGMFQALVFLERRRDALPSPIFAARQDPPLPRLLPNPADSRARPNAPMMGPGEYAIEETFAEDKAVQNLGLMDAGTGQNRIPGNIVDEVAKEGTPGGAPLAGGAAAGGAVSQDPGLSMQMPSDSSGGLSSENGLR